MGRTMRRFTIVLGATALLASLATGVALAGKPAHQSGGGTSSLSLVLVSDSNSDTVPNWGETVTFNVSTTATDYPSVSMDCYQNGTRVYSHSAGFYPTYPWPQSQNFQLQSYVWTSGAADCTADLYYMNSKGKSVTLKTLPVHVND